MKRYFRSLFAVMLLFVLTGCSLDSHDLLKQAPVWLVENGEERRDEIKAIAEPKLTAYLTGKYGDGVKIKGWNFMTRLEGRPESSGTGFIPVYEYYVPVYDGQVIAVCELDGREFTAYVNTGWSESLCYDNYQGEAVIQAIDDYIRTNVDPYPIEAVCAIKSGNGMTSTLSASFAGLDISNMLHRKYDGDIIAFLSLDDGSDLDVSVNYTYVGVDAVSLGADVQQAFSNIDCQIVNFNDESACLSYLDDDKHRLSAYMPYVHDVFSTVWEHDVVVDTRYVMTDYSTPVFIDGGDFIYTLPYCNTTQVHDWSVDVDAEYIDENLWRWVQPEKVSATGDVDGQTAHWVENQNNPVRISNIYAYPNDFTGFIPLNLIQNYNSDKTYKLCKYCPVDSESSGQSPADAYVVEDFDIINGEYVFLDYDADADYWFLIEVENPTGVSSDTDDDAENALLAMANDDGEIDLSDPETGAKFFWEVLKYEFTHRGE